MVAVHSDDVAAMRDATVADLVDDLNRKQSQIPLGITGAACTVLVGVLALLQSGSGPSADSFVIGRIALLAALPVWAIGNWFDSYKRRSVLFYNLEEAAEVAYRKVTEGFDSLVACHGKWHIASGGAVRDLTTWKRNAGAAHLVNRKTARLAYRLPKILRSNVTPPAITLGNRTFYFLPEVMLVKHGGRFGAVGYDDLQIGSQTSRFIEDGAPPADAQVVDYTWKHPNKGGGPDRRFRYNRQLPVCLYEVMHLSSNSGVNELMEFSRSGVVKPFSTALQNLPRRQGVESVGGMVSLGSAAIPEAADVVVPASPRHWSFSWKFLSGAAALMIVGACVAAFALYDGSRTSKSTQGPVADLPSVPTTDAIQNGPPSLGVEAQGSSSTLVERALPNLKMVTVKTAANIRSGPSATATVIRVAKVGESFNAFGRTNGWVQVGTDKPVGWIAGSLLTE